jgi:Putative DNA-binding domain
MSLVDIPLDQIGESDLQRLIATQAPESVYIDYKESTYGPSGDQHREFLADISSFANTVGGDLVIGMTEASGIPTGFKLFRTIPMQNCAASMTWPGRVSSRGFPIF